MKLKMNPDLDMKSRDEYRMQMKEALEKGTTDDFSEALTGLLQSIELDVMEEAKAEMQRISNDNSVLQSRGVRQLTSEETKFYQAAIRSMQEAPNSISDIEVAMPETVINTVFEDLKDNHELLQYIDFQNITGQVRFLLNTNERQLATWGPLNSEIVKELTSGFEDIQLVQSKLSAYMLVSQDMLDLGPRWLDRYVREVLYEGLAYGLEDGIINGTGNDRPIGMTRNLDGAVVSGEYPEKEAEPITALDPTTYGQTLSSLAKNKKGQPRKVTNVIMIVNPSDYLTKIMPATTTLVNGVWVNDILPYPTKIIQSTEMEEGKAVIGMGNKYFMGAGLNKKGKIEYSDEYKFLEDYRTYKVRFLGEGRPYDNNAFKVLDISGLEALVPTVKTISDTPSA